ncbi:protein phosphatase 1 regulatory subunit 32 [Rissa tridactyla]|uniref:protein phosphatase 1 regulatory subunit 32 n=1 Tax=Rissa tridactyla TaxID=75485 RepID=UPI0023BA8A0A|nr:protein phosphatase 1 regulatory subunit 32 [Rissa tridactyla]
MASAPPFVCPRAKLRSLPRGSPAAGLATVTPSAKAHARGSADLMNFYATSYAVAYGQSRFRPCLGRHTVTGYVSNNRWDMSCLLRAAEGHCQDAARSTTAEHFQPLMLPDGRSLLPRHVHQPGSGYLQASSLSCLRTRTASPQHLPLLQGPPNAHREHGTGGRRAGPAQPGTGLGVSVIPGPAPSPGGFGGVGDPGASSIPRRVWGCRMVTPWLPVGLCAGRAGDRAGDRGAPSLPHLPPPDVLQKTTVGTKEQSGFTRATPRSDSVLPGQPLAVSVTATDYLPSVHSHGVETLPALPTGSERGSGFSREVPSCLATAGLPAVGHPLPLISRGLRAPRVTQASPLGQQVVGRMEPSGFTTNHNQYVPPVSPTAPAQCWGGPTWTARPMGGIQPQRPSGFSTNNHPTGLGDIVGHPPLPVAPSSLGTPPPPIPGSTRKK